MNKLKELTSIGFVFGLTILLINDLFLKSYFANWVTGKLSDFAGLFIFPIFWTFVLPNHKDKIYLATVMFFLFWKSPCSNSFIYFTNQILSYNIYRTIDYSDYIALTIIPLSYWYYNMKNKFYITIKPILVLILASFSFMATSYRSHIDFKKTYDFDYPLDTLKKKIYFLKDIKNFYQDEKDLYLIDSSRKFKIHKFNKDTLLLGEIPINKFVKDTMILFVLDDFCFEGYFTDMILSGDNKKSSLRILGFQHNCPKNEKTLTKWNNDHDILSESFEKKIISQLKENKL